MFNGLSAFPLTPMNESGIDEEAFVRLIQRLAAAGVDSIGALGSTGSYAYLTREERTRITRLAVQHAEGIPVMVSISALRTRDALLLAEDAEQAGASGVLLAPVSYQRLTESEVYAHYEAVSSTLSIPLCVYDNPITTNFVFSDELHGRIAQLPQVRSIKIPGVPTGLAEAKARIERLRVRIPSDVTIGISGDPFAAIGLNAGCEAWYSVLGGLFPEFCLNLTRAALAGNADYAARQSELAEPIWALFRQHGSLRVIAAAAELQGAVTSPCLPLPLQSLTGPERIQLGAFLEQLQLK